MKIFTAAVALIALVAAARAGEPDGPPTASGATGVVPAATAVPAATDGTAVAQPSAADEQGAVASAHLRLKYDLRSGRADISLPDGTALLRGVTSAAVFARGEALAADAAYNRRCRVEECR